MSGHLARFNFVNDICIYLYLFIFLLINYFLYIFNRAKCLEGYVKIFKSLARQNTWTFFFIIFWGFWFFFADSPLQPSFHSDSALSRYNL